MSLSITRTYSANNVLTEAQLDAAFDSIETKFNSTLILGSEIANTTIEAANLASNAVTTAKIADGAVTSVKRLVTTTAKTADYTATTADEFIAYDVSGASRTLTLYAASGNAGRKLIVKRTDQTLANTLTIDGNASETIDGATTTTLNTQYEQVTLLCDGSNWHVVERYIPSVTTSYTPTGSWVANSTYTGNWRRDGETVEIEVQIALSAGPTAANLTINLPSGITIDTTKLVGGTNAANPLGDAIYLDASDVTFHGQVWYSSTSAVACRYSYNNDGAGRGTYQAAVSNTAPFLFDNTDFVRVRFRVPVSGWRG